MVKNKGFLPAAFLAVNMLFNAPAQAGFAPVPSCTQLHNKIQETRKKIKDILNMQGQIIHEDEDNGVRVYPKGSNDTNDSVTLDILDAFNTLDTIDSETLQRLRERVPGLVEKMENGVATFSQFSRDTGVPNLPEKYRAMIGQCLSV